MLRITVTANDSPVTIQDPRPVTQHNLEQGVFHIEPGASKDLDISWGQVERVAPQIYALAAAGLITFVMEGTDGPSLSEQADSLSNPVVDYANDGVITAASQALEITGQNLLAGQVMAEATVLADTDLGSVLVKSVDPGAQGNIYDIEVVVVLVSGTASVVINTVDGREVITIDLEGSAAETCTSIAALINNAASPTYGLVQATVVDAGATAITTAKDLGPFEGGVGSGMSVSLAGLPCIVGAVDVSADPVHVLTLATPSLAALSLATGAPLRLQLRSNGKSADITLTHA